MVIETKREKIIDEYDHYTRCEYSDGSIVWMHDNIRRDDCDNKISINQYLEQEYQLINKSK
jgi:hypothetical protein